MHNFTSEVQQLLEHKNTTDVQSFMGTADISRASGRISESYNERVAAWRHGQLVLPLLSPMLNKGFRVPNPRARR
jgi:hypothetical protein